MKRENKKEMGTELMVRREVSQTALMERRKGFRAGSGNE